jgi:hypothetical protein
VDDLARPKKLSTIKYSDLGQKNGEEKGTWRIDSLLSLPESRIALFDHRSSFGHPTGRLNFAPINAAKLVSTLDSRLQQISKTAK